LIAVFAAGVVTARATTTPSTSGGADRAKPSVPFTGAFYVTDAYGDCLRVQTTLASNGTLMVIRMANEACAKRERFGKAHP
jgi:hypothetical protein